MALHIKANAEADAEVAGSALTGTQFGEGAGGDGPVYHPTCKQYYKASPLR